MESLPIMSLCDADDYPRWKESVLLRVHTLGVAYVLSEARPADEAQAKKWARDDAVCRGHILYNLSDHLLPDYDCFATAAELWRALARTYDLRLRGRHALNMLHQFSFDMTSAHVFLEQLAHAKAVGAAAGITDEAVAWLLRGKIPSAFRRWVTPGEKEFESIWEVARSYAAAGLDPWYMDRTEETAETSGKRARRRA